LKGWVEIERRRSLNLCKKKRNLEKRRGMGEKERNFVRIWVKKDKEMGG